MYKEIHFIFQENKLAILSTEELEQKNISQTFILRKICIQEHIYALELVPEVMLDLDLCFLREALKKIPEDLLFLAIRAYSIIRWDKFHQFCGCCGQATEYNPPLFERKCDQCQQSYFPRISPCIIVRINRGKDLLLTRSYHFAPGIYGLVAGYIEPGESAENAVYREVLEETGIKIKNLKYFASQPWPFPDALMIGFIAEYDSGKLKIDLNELEAGGWYDVKNLPGRPANPKSIASLLIDDFINTN